MHQGGTRSSKTYSIAQFFIIELSQVRGRTLTVVRKTGPSLRTSVMRDFFDILKSAGLYSESRHDKTNRQYTLFGNTVEFISMDEPQKKRGTKRDYLWLNEANEFTYEDFFQLSIRTSGLTVMDYNPSDEVSWIYDKILDTRTGVVLIKSTYNDNPFLDKKIVAEIEALKDVDPDYWAIYGCGERAHAAGLIYNNWDTVEEFPENCDEILVGVDFGFNNPSAVIKVGIKDALNAYIDELIYDTKLTNTDLIVRMEGVDRDRSFYYRADSAEPDRIEEIVRAGFACEGVGKGKHSVKDGIDVVKKFKLHVTKRSEHVLYELKRYKWRADKSGNRLDEPVPLFNHAMDAIRYALGERNPANIGVSFL